MNQHAKVDIRHSTCPHDCPSACALDIEVIEGKSIGRVRGSKLQTYTAGVVCAKVARYAERIHHPDRLLYPMRRTGPKGSGQFARIKIVVEPTGCLAAAGALSNAIDLSGKRVGIIISGGNVDPAFFGRCIVDGDGSTAS